MSARKSDRGRVGGKPFWRRAWRGYLSLFEEERTDEPGYDPADLAAAIVYFFFGIGILYWTLWCLWMYKGGLFAKILPFLSVVFTSRTLADYGYEGWPYELGVFEGWMVNLGGLLFLIFLIWAARTRWLRLYGRGRGEGG